MDSKSYQSLSLPVIDFSAQMNPNFSEWETVKIQVIRALEEFGCFEALLKNFHLSKLKEELFGLVQEFFYLPLETKRLINNVSNKVSRSYNGHELAKKLPYEAVNINNANILKDLESFASILWPQGNPSFCKTIVSYTNQLSELQIMIMKMIFESLGIEKYLKEYLDSTKNFTLRLTKYEDRENNGTKQALQTHTDKGSIINILGQNQIDGLEVQTKDGQWFLVKPSSNSFVVILGDVLATILANGRLYCPVHRVIINGNQTRYSAGMFCNVKEDCLIKTPKELVDEENPLAYKPFYISQYLKFLYVDGGNKIDSPLKEFCGV